MEDKITLKGNGSFYIREGWLTKGLVEIEKNPEVEYPRKYQDYTVTIHEDAIPDTVEVKRMI